MTTHLVPGLKKRDDSFPEENHCLQWKTFVHPHLWLQGRESPSSTGLLIVLSLHTESVTSHWVSRNSARAGLKGASKCCLQGGIQAAVSFWRFNVVGWLLELQQHGHLGNMQRQVKWLWLRMKYLNAIKALFEKNAIWLILLSIKPFFSEIISKY